MKLSHAAALALVGWYLMAPPVHAPNHKVDFHAPLAKWTILGSFDKAEDCEMADLRLRQTPQTTKGLSVWEAADLCIATDDPRLKSK
jgi:hypothetical protein